MVLSGNFEVYFQHPASIEITVPCQVVIKLWIFDARSGERNSSSGFGHEFSAFDRCQKQEIFVPQHISFIV